jgi:pyruvate dehydrogenase E2 component (dihydrolipoamide acetyltransferase)
MSSILKMPRLGETMQEGTLVAWMVEPGKPFARGDALLEVETDKTVVEFPALGDGILLEMLAHSGQTIAVGDPIARIDTGDGPDWTGGGEEEETASPAPSSGPASDPASDPGTTAEPSPLPAPSAPVAGGAVRATPLARRMARARGLSLASLSGTGRRGRIERRDVEAAAATGALDLPRIAGLACKLEGPQHGTPVLLLHGFAADHAAWAAVQAQLARAGRRTLAPDLPGHGASLPEAASTDALHGPVAACLAEALPGSTPHVIAHSMGAIAAVRLAQQVPVASLTLIAPAGLGQHVDGAFLRGLAHATSAGEAAHLLRRITDAPQVLSAALQDQIFATLARRRLVALADALAGPSGQAVDIRGDLAALAARMPVRLILGHRDRIFDWREALDVSPRIAVHHLPRAGHTPQWEALAEVTALLMEATQAR